MQLGEDQKQAMRDRLEEAMSIDADYSRIPVLIAIHYDGEGKIWQQNHTEGQLALSAISIFTQLSELF